MLDALLLITSLLSGASHLLLGCVKTRGDVGWTQTGCLRSVDKDLGAATD